MTEAARYSVPSEAAKVLRDGILTSPLTRKHLIDGLLENYGDTVSFEGPDDPVLPVNWRFAESLSALKGLEAVYINAILDKLYGIAPQKVKINTNHVILFIMSLQLWSLDPQGENVTFMDTRLSKKAKDFYLSKFEDFDYHRSLEGPYRCCASNIYKTADDKFFHLHGSLNPDVVLNMLKLPAQPPNADDQFHRVLPIFNAAIAQWEAEDIDMLSNDVIKTAGCIANSLEEYRQTDMGKANEHVGLWETTFANRHQKPTWWTGSAGKVPSDPSRPLAGLKVLDATRIIAGPATTRGLAELGATILRITAKAVPDATIYHPEFNWGKRNAALDLEQDADRAMFKELILECDVFLSSYRPTVMEKWGFGADDVLEMCKRRDKGIIVARLNSYGWNGPMRDRSGWQQISDAHTGVSWEFGRALGYEEPVTPVFPNSDFCTGVSGICSILDAVIRRAEQGGSYTINLALDYYNNWLTRNVGVYPNHIWKKLHQHYDSPCFRHNEHMLVLIERVSKLLKKYSPEVFDPQFMENRPCPNLGIDIRTVKPVLQFANVVRPGFDIGTRGNGVDRPTWADVSPATRQ